MVPGKRRVDIAEARIGWKVSTFRMRQGSVFNRHFVQQFGKLFREILIANSPIDA